MLQLPWDFVIKTPYEVLPSDPITATSSVLLHVSPVIMAALFLPCGFFLLTIYYLFLTRLISAAADWMSTILRHMVWP